MDIFLDTNTFYYAADISKPESINVEKLIQEFEGHQLVLSVVSLYEFIMLYGEEPDIVHKGAQFLHEYKVRIKYSKYFPKPQNGENYVKHLATIHKDDLIIFKRKIFEEKVESEIRYAAIVFHLCFFSGMYFAINSESQIPSELASDLCIRISNSMVAPIFDEFYQIYKTGYSTKSCEKYVKTEFYNLLSTLCQYFIPIIKESLQSGSEINIEQFLEQNIDWKTLVQQEAFKIEKCERSTVYLSNLARCYETVTKDCGLRQYMGRIRKIFSILDLTNTLRDYLCDIVLKCCRYAGGFQKNDILDAMIICSLTEQEVIITYDNGPIKHMEKHQAGRKAYENSLKMINRVKHSITR